MNPDRVVVGAGPESAEFADRVEKLYEPLGAPIVRTDVASAEMIKLASNAFLATKISFINEIANVSEELGADVEEVARGMGLDERIGPHFLRAGIGYGGSCFPKDVSALKQLAGNSGYHFQLLSSVIEVNELQKRRTIGKLQKHLGSLVDREIALLGAGVQAAHRRRARGDRARAGPPPAGRGRDGAGLRPGRARAARTSCWRRGDACKSAEEALEGADAAVLVTEWPEFRELDWAGSVKDVDAQPAGGGRPQLPRRRGAARGRLHLRGDRPGRRFRRSRPDACRRSSSPVARARGCGRSR